VVLLPHFLEDLLKEVFELFVGYPAARSSSSDGKWMVTVIDSSVPETANS
jgi:hypothetical protein